MECQSLEVAGFEILTKVDIRPHKSPHRHPLPPARAPTHSLLLWCACRGGGRQTLLAVHQLAVGLPQGSLQLVDAGLVLQQEVLRLIQKLEENVQKVRDRGEKGEMH